MSDIDKAINVIGQAIGQFEGKLPALETKLLNELLTLVKQLHTTTDGKISTSIENLKLVNRIQSKLKGVIENKMYLKEVAEFAKAFDKVASYQDAYFSGIGAMTKKGLLQEMKKSARDGLVRGLVGAGLEQTLSENIIEELKTAVLARESYSVLVQRLQAIKTTPTNAGLLAKHSKTYARDAINDFMGQRNRVIGESLGLKWFMYVGSNLTTTREFCEHLTKKKYIHESEIPTILSGDIDGHQCEIYAKTKLPVGLVAGTDASNFAIYRGGWNCGHQLVPVADEAVPADLRAKFEKQPAQDAPTPFVMDEDATEKLKQSGFQIDSPGGLEWKDFADRYNESSLAGFDMVKFDKSLEDEFAKDGISVTRKTIKIDGSKAKFYFEGKFKGDRDVQLVRIFSEEDGVKNVHHDLFVIPEKLQGKGLSKRVFRLLYEQYKNAGVQTVDVFANINVGGYTWAKYGFTAERREYNNLSGLAKDRLKSKSINVKEYNDFAQWLNAYKDKEIPLYEVAYGKEYGKKMLLGSNWEGYINFADAKTKKIFEDYIAKN
jgi:hypothetical protein